MLRYSLPLISVLFLISPLRAEFCYDIFKRVDPSAFRVAQRDAAWPVADKNGAAIEFVCLTEDELVVNAIDWINRYVRQETKREIAVRSEKSQRAVLHIAFGEAAAKDFHVDIDPGPQGFVLKQIGSDMLCWSPTALGCRYGLIEFLRSLKTKDGVVVSDIQHVLDAPDFPVRIHYVNFAEHLQNAYNVNVLFETEICQWNLADWERYIDMVSAYRYNIFEFWLVPSLLGRDDQQKCDEFVKTINHVIAYARRRGVAVHPIVAVNTLGGEWFYACPNDPNEKKRILDAWEFWTKSMQGNAGWGVFPGDPGGCIRNGCTKETFVDLALELSTIIRRNNPGALIEVGTWGEPFAGWGLPLWTANRELAERSMEYLLKKLPEFPPGTFTSINRGFNPDCDPTGNSGQYAGWGGGDGRPYARRAAALMPVLTWDYSVTEGEATVFPHCRVRRMIDIRKVEWEDGCYSGGICYTMAPQLQNLSAFCSAETWWNPHRNAEDILGDFGRWTFGDGKESIGRLLEEFEVIPDWGYYAPFPYTAARLAETMNRLSAELTKLDTAQSPRLSLAVDYAGYVKSLEFFATLFRDLAEVSLTVDTMNAAFRNTSLAGESKDNISLSAIQDILATKTDFDGRGDLETAAKELAALDIKELKKRYWDAVYGIYDHLVAPTDPRTGAAMSGLFNRFQASLAEPRLPSALEEPLQATGKPYCLIPLGGRTPPGWKMIGWDVHGADGEAWSACMSEGTLSSETFENQNYRWLILRIAEGVSGSKKAIWINGRKIGEFVRTGPPGVKEWFVTRSFPLPEGILDGSKIEITFTEPGIGIAGIAFSAAEIQE